MKKILGIVIGATLLFSPLSFADDLSQGGNDPSQAIMQNGAIKPSKSTHHKKHGKKHCHCHCKKHQAKK